MSCLGSDDDEGVVGDLLELRREVVPGHEALDVLGGVLHVQLGRLQLLLVLLERLQGSHSYMTSTYIHVKRKVGTV